LYEGQITSRDLPAAGKALAHGCELGDPMGCGGVHHMVNESQGSFFESACDKGDGESCFLLASLYYAGAGGIAKDPSRAFALFQKSCSSGWSRGCGGLGECYRTGTGTTEDDALALENFDKACRAGVASSCFSGSSMYRSQHNNAKAQARLRQGCEIGVSFAKSNEAYFEKGSLTKAALAPAFCSSTGS
jgi:TPR repeat protein